ncbi:hypothetical protein BJY01DRAFT_79836 [Aspergillus pseudoustus]|uniref:Aldehyde dehydrogenase domain-containing protein n=1 Tax=Aspergillus pseudoustus TaxID=1810923 RepID=A0ABR4J437_9EURO
MHMATALESGYVDINCSGPTVTPDLLFGGSKISGQGRQNSIILETKSLVTLVEGKEKWSCCGAGKLRPVQSAFWF